MKEIDEFLELKIKLFKAILIFFGLMAFVMSIVRFYEESYFQFAVDISLLLVIVIGYIKLKFNHQNFYIIFRIVLFFGFLAAFGLLLIVNQSPIRLIWFSTVVYIMFYMLGKREGWWWVAIITLVLIGIFTYDSTILNLNKKEFFTWLFNMLIILVVVNWYEEIKEIAIQKHKNIQSLLQKEVNIKTAQLQALNNDLETRIEIAVSDLKKSQKQAKLGSWKLDIIHNQLSWSDETYHILGLIKTSDVVSYEDFLSSIYPDDLEKVKAAYTKSLENQEAYEIVHRVLLKNGQIKYVREQCETTFDSSGNALFSFGTIQDITNECLVEEKLREKKDMLFKQSRLAQMGEMITMIAHQWRQPLSAISSTTNTLILKNMRGAYERELFEEKLQKIAMYSQHLSTTIDDFRNFFKTNKEKEETTFEAVMKDALNIIQPSLENKNINIVTDFKYNKKVNIYTNELKQVLLNLMKNAEDALVDNKVINPEITLRIFEENTCIVLSVEDNAGGIDELIIDKIFDLYFSTKLDKEGTGIGLYMSKTIIQEHCAGTLNVKNGQKGAIFIIEICDKSVVMQ